MSDSFATPWTAACQAPLSMGFFRQDTGVGCSFLLQGIFLTQGSNLCLLHSQADSSPLSYQGSPKIAKWYTKMIIFSKCFRAYWKTIYCGLYEAEWWSSGHNSSTPKCYSMWERLCKCDFALDLEWWGYPELSGWAMMQSQMSLQGRDVGRFETGRGGGNVTTETEISVMWPQAKDCRQPPEPGRCKEEIPP